MTVILRDEELPALTGRLLLDQVGLQAMVGYSTLPETNGLRRRAIQIPLAQYLIPAASVRSADSLAGEKVRCQNIITGQLCELETTGREAQPVTRMGIRLNHQTPVQPKQLLIGEV